MARLEALIDILDRSRKRIAIAFGLAILLHLPATPVVPVLRLMHRMRGSEPPPISTVSQPPLEVEVELREALKEEERRKEQQNRPVEPSPKETSLAMTPPPSGGVKFAQSSPTPESDPEAAKDAKKKEKVKDVGLEGLSKSNSKPGLTLGLWLSSVRNNPLGKRLVELAACDREWKMFAEHGVDLLHDFEGVLVVGPGLFQGKEMTVAVRHSLPAGRVHEVVDGLVHQSGANGRWVSSDVATARLGNVQRMLLPQQSDLFFVTPTKGWEALHDVKEPLHVPTAEGRVVSVVLAPPTKVLARAGLALPKRISEMRLEVFANPDQSLDIRVELEDASPEAAMQDLVLVNRQTHEFFADAWSVAGTLGTLTGADGDDSSRPETAPRLDLSVDEKTLSGMIHLSPAQTRTTLGLASSILCRKTKHKNGK
jgi:hypothetical protein